MAIHGFYKYQMSVGANNADVDNLDDYIWGGDDDDL